jgi:hypothetical protein
MCIDLMQKLQRKKVKQKSDSLFNIIAIRESDQNSIWAQLYWQEGFKYWDKIAEKY